MGGVCVIRAWGVLIKGEVIGKARFGTACRRPPNLRGADSALRPSLLVPGVFLARTGMLAKPQGNGLVLMFA